MILDASEREWTEYTAFDILGRVTGHKQTTDGNEYTTGYTYYLSGAVNEQTYPSGRVVKNTLDADGSLGLVQSKKTSSDFYRPYSSNFLYNAAGAVTAMRLGNGRWENTEFNSRLQPTKIGLGSGVASQSLLKLEYSYGTTANNGNVVEQKITVPGVAHPFVQNRVRRLGRYHLRGRVVLMNRIDKARIDEKEHFQSYDSLVMKRKAIISVILASVVLGLYPYETQVVPLWSVRFVNDQGFQMSNLDVEQVCYDYTFSEANVCGGYSDSRQRTDTNGEVAFVAKSIRIGAFSRIIRFVVFQVARLAHGSSGIRASLMVSIPDEYDSAGVFTYDSNQLPPSEIVLRKR